jgi:hypothetical protein
MNPFPDPPDVDLKIAQELAQSRENKLATDGKIMFHEIMEDFEKTIEYKDIPRAKILGWYITNSILDTDSISDDEKIFIIAGMKKEVDIIESK